MEIFITEHGGVLKSAVISIFILTILISSVGKLHELMPNYDTYEEKDNAQIIKIIKNSSPVIVVDEVIYVEYRKKFQILDHISAKDFDGTDITKNISVEGIVDTNERGLYTLIAKVVGRKGYSTKKKINVIVE